MATQNQRVVPGVNMAALDNIADQNTRDVLRAIVDGWHTRNGFTGSGDHRFITAAEAGLTKGSSTVGAAGSGSGQAQSPAPLLKSSDIGRLIGDLQALIIESPLFKILGERVDLIDEPGGIFSRLGTVEIVVTNEIQQRHTADEAEIAARTALGVRVGAAESGLVTETNLRANADSALAQSVSTQFANVSGNLALVQQSVTTVSNTVASQGTTLSQVQASVGTNTAAIQQVSQASANADGVINSKITIKIDINGYVGGYGLMGSANNSTPTFDFIVRADKFAIGSPSGPNIAPQVPFIVLTTPIVIDGHVVPPGVYIDKAVIKSGDIDTAKIADAAITNAKIGTAAVGTLTIAGNAVTVPYAHTFVGTTDGSGLSDWHLVAEGTITLDQAGVVFAASTGLIAYGSGWVNAQSYLSINGVTVSSGGGAEAWVNASHSGGLACGEGTVTARLYFSATDSRARIIDPTLFIMGAKR